MRGAAAGVRVLGIAVLFGLAAASGTPAAPHGHGNGHGNGNTNEQSPARHDSTTDRTGEEPASAAAATCDLTVEVVAAGPDGTVAVPGCTVTVAATDASEQTAKTDTTGAAVFAGLDRGRWTLVAEATDFLPDTTEVELTGSAQMERVTLHAATGNLTIVLLGDEGDGADPQPVKKGHVQIELAGETRKLPPTDDEGEIRVSLPKGRLTITVLAKGWETEHLCHQLSEDEDRLEIRLAKLTPPK